jgi:protocatechuate 3,4-dioxygenase beta subunit
MTTLMLLVLSVCSLGQTIDSTKSSKPAGSISGKVTLKGKGMAGVAVGLRRSEMMNPFETPPRGITDQDGNYKIPNVVAGSYQVLPSAPAYVPDSISRPRIVVVGEGENVESINFSFVRGGVITGRITDAESRPAIQQQVQFFRADPPNKGADSTPPVNYPVSSATTDDRGIYRAFGLRPGRYKVSVGRGDNVYSGYMPGSRAISTEVFYPDATEFVKASIIEVGEGTEATNIDITLGRNIETFTASGRVIEGERGEPVPYLRFGLQRIAGSNDRSEFVNSFMSTNTRGEFSVEGLTPGKYALVLTQEGTSDMRTDNTTFDVIDSDVSRITIRLVKGATISGVVVLETDDKQALGKLSHLQVFAHVENAGGGDSFSNTSRSPLGADGSFRTSGLPSGLAFLNLGPLSFMTEMKGFIVTRIERDGVVQPKGIDVKEGEQVSGVRVIVEYGNAILRGRVNIENGSLPQGARIMVRLATPGGSPLNLRSPMVDERGRFVAEGIPAGTYEVTVSVFGTTTRIGRNVKQQVVLQNGSATEVTINLDLADAQKP